MYSSDDHSSQQEERASSSALPVLQVNVGKGKEFEAFVTAYVVGGAKSQMASGLWLTPLYYISLIAAKGQGTTLQGLFATLAGQQIPRLWLSDVGQVALANQQARLADLDCAWHWTQKTLENGHLHAVIEPSLTYYDPTLVPVARRNKHHATSTTQESSQTSSPDPSWLFLVPRWLPTEEVPQRHFTFLDARLPWPLWPSWATFLWERGLRTQEIEPLTVWCATRTPMLPLLSAAYLCRPRSTSLIADLQRALKEQRLPLPHAETGTPVPASI